MSPGAYQFPFASKITGTGSAFPERRVTNDDLKKYMETDDTWIRERTGISQRRVSDIKNESEHNSSLALRAALSALEMAGKRPEDIDQILYATCTPDTLVPSAACWLQKKIGATRASAVDLNAACSGFIYGLSLADQSIKTGQSKCTLLIGAEVLSPFVDWTDRGTGILFGDGAGAVVIESVSPTNTSRVLSSHLGADGRLWELFYIPAGGSSMENTQEAKEQKLDKMKMKGKEIFKVAVKTLAEYAETALTTNDLTLKDVDWVIPHQANLRIIEATAKRLDFPMEKVLINIDRYGNTSAACVPTMLDEAVRDGRIKPGHVVLMTVFGAGLTYGSAILRF
jgi:3-oxoacyl-[acyl-carrier-protein] synthase-3